VSGVNQEERQRVDADGDEDVVDHGDDRRQRHLPLEEDRDVDGDQDEEDDERLDGLWVTWPPKSARLFPRYRG